MNTTNLDLIRSKGYLTRLESAVLAYGDWQGTDGEIEEGEQAATEYIALRARLAEQEARIAELEAHSLSDVINDVIKNRFAELSEAERVAFLSMKDILEVGKTEYA